jgi:hypothetical protein
MTVYRSVMYLLFLISSLVGLCFKLSCVLCLVDTLLTGFKYSIPPPPLSITKCLNIPCYAQLPHVYNYTLLLPPFMFYQSTEILCIPQNIKVLNPPHPTLLPLLTNIKWTYIQLWWRYLIPFKIGILSKITLRNMASDTWHYSFFISLYYNIIYKINK